MGTLASLLRGLSWRQPGGILSATLHVGLILGSVMAFSSAKPYEPASEAVPIDVITDKQFNEMTQGDVKAKEKLPEPVRRVDQVAQTKQEADPGEAKKEVATEPPKAKQAPEPAEPKPEPPQKVAVAAPPPPRPPELRVKPPEPAPPAKAEEEEEEEVDDKAELLKKITPKKPEPKKEEAKPEPPKPDPLAKMLEQQKLEEKAKADAKAKAEADAKAKAKAEAEKKKAEADKRAKEAKEKQAKEAAESKNLENSIQKLLTSKEAPAAVGSTGAVVQRQASLGTPNATGRRLSPSERSQLIALLAEKIGRCFNNPGSAGPKTVPILRVQIGRDGSLITSPVIANNSGEPSFRPYADAILRATRSCAPYAIPARFLDTYEDWKNLQISLDLSDL